MEKVTISKAEYENLLDKQRLLDCLEECGVDNWPGYGEAVAMSREEEEE